MSQLLPTLFTRHDLTPEEEIAAIQFTECQRMFIQNIIADAAEEKVRLTFDPTVPHEFLQREAALAGTIMTLTNLLERHSDYLSTLEEVPT